MGKVKKTLQDKISDILFMGAKIYSQKCPFLVHVCRKSTFDHSMDRCCISVIAGSNGKFFQNK